MKNNNSDGKAIHMYKSLVEESCKEKNKIIFCFIPKSFIFNYIIFYNKFPYLICNLK